MTKRLMTIGLCAAGLLLSAPGMAALDDVTMDVVESDSGSVAEVTREIELPESMLQEQQRIRERHEYRVGDDGDQPGELDRDRIRDRDELREYRDSDEMTETREQVREETREQAREGQQEMEDSQREMQTERETVRNELHGDNGKGGQ